MISKGFFPITPGAALARRAYGFYVTGGGTVVGTDAEGEAFTITAASNSYHPVELLSVGAGSTATGIFGLKRHWQ